MKILLLSRYDTLGASSRYRSYQYLPYLSKKGFEITVAPLVGNDYLKRLYSGNKKSLSNIVSNYSKRIIQLINSAQYDLIWLEKEAFPWIPAWLESLLFKSNIPYVVDYDDAVFHRYDQHNSGLVRWFLGKKIDQVMSKAALVIAGNNYLAQKALNAGANRVEILPTVIDLERYKPITLPEENTFTIGWIGSPMKSYTYLKTIQPALKEICKDDSTRVVAIGAAQIELEGVLLEIQPWSEATEVEQMQKFDVGIMPLTHTPFEQGKCGFKLIQYMACNLPVVASPVGVNNQIIRDGTNGYKASSIEEWIEAFSVLKNDSLLRKKMGNAGRKIVEENYCLQVTEHKLARLLSEVTNITK